MQGRAASTRLGVFVGAVVGMLVEELVAVLTGAGMDVPQANKTRAKASIRLKIKTFLIFKSLTRMNIELLMTDKPISAMQEVR